jgi:small multidrug resistance pump
MKASEGLSRFLPSLFIFVCYVLSLIFLTLSLRKLEIGLVYAIWSGIGTALITAIGVVYFKESLSLIKILSILLIIFGVIGLNFQVRE